MRCGFNKRGEGNRSDRTFRATSSSRKILCVYSEKKQKARPKGANLKMKDCLQFQFQFNLLSTNKIRGKFAQDERLSPHVQLRNKKNKVDTNACSWRESCRHKEPPLQCDRGQTGDAVSPPSQPTVGATGAHPNTAICQDWCSMSSDVGGLEMHAALGSEVGPASA